MRIITLLLTIVITSCNTLPKKQFDYEPSIAAITHAAEMKYLNQHLQFYSTLSETGKDLYSATKELEERTFVFKEKIMKGEPIGVIVRFKFFDEFRKTFNESQYVDYDQWEKLKEIPFNTVADVDMIERYIKTCYFYILNDSKILPFTAFGVNACASATNINYGEPFTCDLSVLAYNTARSFEWYVADGEDENKILDTLRQGEDGRVMFSTTNYRKGTNRLQFICNVRNHNGDQKVMREVTFIVK